MGEPDDKKSEPPENRNKSVNEVEMENIKSWNENNINTLLSWISISSFNIACLEDAIIIYRNYIRYNIILGLVLSTSAGTLSVTQYSTYFNDKMQFVFNMLFTLLTFTISLSTGYIKIYQVQERLENFITIKQEWIVFIASIATEFQLPINLRKSALHLIQANKAKYLDLLKSDDEIPERVKRAVTKRFQRHQLRKSQTFHPALEIGAFALSITDILMNIGYIEGKNVMLYNKLKKGVEESKNGDGDGKEDGKEEEKKEGTDKDPGFNENTPRFLRQAVSDNRKPVNLADLSIDEYLKNNYVNNISRQNSFCLPPNQSTKEHSSGTGHKKDFHLPLPSLFPNSPQGDYSKNYLDNELMKNEIRLNIRDEVEVEVDRITHEIMRSLQYENGMLLNEMKESYHNKIMTLDALCRAYKEQIVDLNKKLMAEETEKSSKTRKTEETDKTLYLDDIYSVKSSVNNDSKMGVVVYSDEFSRKIYSELEKSAEGRSSPSHTDIENNVGIDLTEIK
jgi:hypothetical protein